MRLKGKKQSERRDLLVLSWSESGHLIHVSQCRTERGAAISQKYSQSFKSHSYVQIVDARDIRALGDATTRDTEIAELEKMFNAE